MDTKEEKDIANKIYKMVMDYEITKYAMDDEECIFTLQSIYDLMASIDKDVAREALCRGIDETHLLRDSGRIISRIPAVC